MDNNIFSTDKEEVGIAFSGGGIRSASFCSGVLKCLCLLNIYKEKRFVFSCVSGGGYIGSGFCYIMSQESDPLGRWRAYSKLDDQLRSSKNNIGYLINFEGGWWLLDIFVKLLPLLLFALVTSILKLFPFVIIATECLTFFIESIPIFWAFISIIISGAAATILWVASKILLLLKPHSKRNASVLWIKNALKILFIILFIQCFLTLSVMSADAFKKLSIVVDESFALGFSIVSKLVQFIGLIVLYPFLTLVYDRALSKYYRVSITKSFYGANVSPLVSSLKNRNRYISNLSSNAWVQSSKLSSHFIISVGDFGPRSDSLGQNGANPPNSNVGYSTINMNEPTIANIHPMPYQISMPYLMANSGAAIAPNKNQFGSAESQLKITNLSLGSWMGPQQERTLKNALTYIGVNFVASVLVSIGLIVDSATDYGWTIFLSPVVMIALSLAFDRYFGNLPIVPRLIQDIRHLFSIPIYSKELVGTYLSDGGHLENTGILAILFHCPHIDTIVAAAGYEDSGRRLKDLKKVLRIGRMNGWTFTSPEFPDLKDALLRFSQPEININNNNNSEMRRRLIINATHQQNQRKVKIIHLQPIAPKEKQKDGMYRGCCCECCGDCDFRPFTWVCETLFGKFPNLSTGIQFFNKKMYNAYKQEGINAFNEINQNNIKIDINNNNNNNNDKQEGIDAVGSILQPSTVPSQPPATTSVQIYDNTITSPIHTPNANPQTRPPIPPRKLN
ncbi:hypothetical protein DFA_12266 [Cavenderia fasciculata]|uniref:PNPLA domain-containing protein n=1 Tax=Cavenderia fasciculata TaxID=261658 RepID=F4QCW7_CACFS|nr:uncharacterized protein DFA_12266 [Cavenderia fasciculata]EGG14491.1 hypothetical protein DFA_12266 [Cavenderia fasciculata]|eukprot:XP_004353900.1 hypothetical protein DFA_12266 [Cavenderia fasciculata]